MNETLYRPADSLRYRIAPTEVTPPRGYPLQGEVHDENAYALGGIAGHAGLFSTAADLSIFAQMMLNGGEYNGVQIISKSTVDLFTSRSFGHRALGWDTADGDYGSGRYLGPTAYGHTGFTGTSMWIDPEREMFVILLTNRVHAARALRPAKVISDVRADLSDAAVLSVLDGPKLASGSAKLPRRSRGRLESSAARAQGVVTVVEAPHDRQRNVEERAASRSTPATKDDRQEEDAARKSVPRFDRRAPRAPALDYGNAQVIIR